MRAIDAVTVAPTVAPVHIRWMIRRDMLEVLAIEGAGFAAPRAEEDFLKVLRQRDCIGMVAETTDGSEKVIGFMVYRLHKRGLEILDFAAHPGYRRAGVGRQMAAKLVGKLSARRRLLIRVDVREINLDAQLFFRAQGFRAVGVRREHFEDTGEASFRMEYRLAGEDS
jgi:ribosomal-protein-alanine N-acetyltransferase